MSDDLTPWEEINPPMVSAPRREPPLRCSANDRVTFRNELTACLTLTAPVGMTEEQRRDWLVVAWDSLKHLPPEILEIGARKARLKCDHPSKIVPTIIAETNEHMGRRSRMAEWDSSRALPAPEPEYCSPEEAAKILRSVGLKSHFAPVDRSPEGQDGATRLDRNDESAVPQAGAKTS